MKTDSDLDRQLRSLLRQGLDHEGGPDPTWAESPAARRVAEGERRARYRWPLRILAVAALLGAIGGAALLGGALPDVSQIPANGWIAFTVEDRLDGDLDIWFVALDQDARRVIGTDTDGVDQLCPAFSPDGRSLSYGQPGALVVADVSADGRVADRLTVDVAGTPCPVWSPDGGQVAFGVNRTSPVNPATSAAGSEVWIVTLADRHVTVLPDLLATDLEWSPDGSFLAIASGVDEIVPGNRLHDGRISLYAPSSGALRQLDATLGATKLTWSPDRRLIAYMAIADMTGDTFHELRIIDFETERQRVVGEGFAAVHGIGPVWSPDGESIVYQRRCCGAEVHEVVLVSPGDLSDESAVPSEVVIPRPEVTVQGSDYSLLPWWVTWSPDGEYLLYRAWASAFPSDPGLEYLAAVPIDRDLPVVLLADLDGMQAYTGYDDTTFVPIQTWGRRLTNDSSEPSAAASEPEPTVPPSPTASLTPDGTPVELPPAGSLDAGTYFLVNPYVDDDPVRDCAVGCADYRRIVFTLPAGWATSDGLVYKHLGQPDEVAFSAWTPGRIYLDPCHWEESVLEELNIHTASGNPHLGMDDQAALLNQVGRTASVPTTVTFVQTFLGERWPDGVGALKIELTVDPELDLASCDRAEFRSWTEWDVPDGANSHHAPGQVDVLYLVDVDRRTFVIDASHMPAASGPDLAELEAILASMIIDR